MLDSMGTSTRAVDPVFAEIAKSLLGDDADVRELWDLAKGMPDTSDVSTPGGAQPAPKKKKSGGEKLGAALALGTVAESDSALHAARDAFPGAAKVASDAAAPVTRVLKPILSSVPKLPSGAGSKARFALQATNLGLGLAGAHELLKKPKDPQQVTKAWPKLRLRPVKASSGQESRTAQLVRESNERIARDTARAKRRSGRGVAKSLRPVPAADQYDLTWSGEIAKFDTDKRQVFGWCSLSTVDGKPVVDLQGDYVPIEEIEKSAYRYVLESRKGGDMHKRVNKGFDVNDAPMHTSDLVESFVVTPEKLEKMGLPADSLPMGWWVGFKVHDDAQWDLVKKGERAGFSIHGTGQRRPFEHAVSKLDAGEKVAVAGTAAAAGLGVYAAHRGNQHRKQRGQTWKQYLDLEPRPDRSLKPKTTKQWAAQQSLHKGERTDRVKRNLHTRMDTAKNPPAVKLTPVKSSAINRVGYQKPTRSLAVEMKSRAGAPYNYRARPRKAQRFQQSPSLGRAYSQQIRGTTKRKTKITTGDRARLFLAPVGGS